MTERMRVRRPSPHGGRAHAAAAADTVQGTVHRVPGGEVVQLACGDLTIFQIKGRFGAELAREADRLAAGCRTDVGLDLSGVTGIGPGVIPLLDRLQRRAREKKRAFRLSNVTPRLADALKLGGVYERFCGANPPSGAPKEILDPGAGDEVDSKISTITHSLRRTAQLERSLDTAEKRLSKLFPRALPQRADVGFASFYRPCEKIGGDFYDFVGLPGDRLGVVVGDVSGHGLEAAVVMGMVKKLIQVRAREASAPSPAAILARVNRDLYDDLDRNTFATVFLGILEPARPRIRFARAGHEPPLVVRGPRIDDVEGLRPSGLGLAMAPGPLFEKAIDETDVVLQPGQSLIVTTDGIVEAWDRRGRPFGRDRLREAAARAFEARSAEAMASSVLAAVGRFAGDAHQEDDMTGVVLHAEGA